MNLGTRRKFEDNLEIGQEEETQLPDVILKDRHNVVDLGKGARDIDKDDNE